MEKKQTEVNSNDKLTRLQLEQIIIRLKFELSQYKSKVQEYEESHRYDKMKKLRFEKQTLLKKMDDYKRQLKNAEDERTIIKAKAIELEEENKAYRIQLNETKALLASQGCK